jgi:hypothetical protein
VSAEWKFVFHEEPMQFLLRLRGAERDDLFKALQRLRANPNQRPHAYTNGPSGRKYLIFYGGRFGIAYWLDEFVRELRVVGITRLGGGK